MSAARDLAHTRPVGRPGTRGSCSGLLFFILVGIAQGLVGVEPISAQQVEREVRIPVAPEAGILEISAELRSRLGLFPEAAGFTSARLFLQEGGVTILVIETLSGGELARERRALSEPDLVALRDLVAERLAASEGTVPLNRDGRGGFVLGQTLLGLGFYGWAVPVVLDLDSARGQVASYLLTAGATFYLTYRLSANRSVSEAHRNLSLHGGTRGILAGLLIGDAMVAGDALTDRDSDERFRVRVGLGLAGSVAGSMAGFYLAGRARPDAGSAALWTSLGDLGFLAGAGTAYATGPYASRTILREDGDFVWEDSETRNRAVGHLMTVAGGAIGLAAGGWLGGRRSYTEGNVGALRSAGILGAQVGATLTHPASDEARAVVGGAIVGGLAGIVAGDRLVRERRFTRGEGLLINAGHLAGGATALGVTWLLAGEVDNNALLYLATSTAGSFLGAGLVYRALGTGSAPTGFGAAAPAAGGGRQSARPGVSLTLHPENLFLSGLSGPRADPLPLLTVRF